jgi:FtsP/CotA-like multicopper oxidase with cupredoxin domain
LSLAATKAWLDVVLNPIDDNVEDDDRRDETLTRRRFLKAATGSLAVGAGVLTLSQSQGRADHYAGGGNASAADRGMGPVGRVDSEYPEQYLRTFHRGKPVPPDALQKARNEGWPEPDVFYEIHAVDREIEIAPGVMFPAWTYGMLRDGTTTLQLQGNVPGPTLRANEGDEILIKFVNQGSHPHTIHFHGVHEEQFDGSMPGDFVYPEEVFWYRFRAEPYGLHLYHCHSVPLKRHVHKGLYGTFIVDPDPSLGVRTPAGNDPQGRPQELVMMMNGFDTNFDGDNEVYAVNSVANYYTGDRSIPVTRNTLVRVYLVNITEFDPINSFHLHANFYYSIRTGTRVMTWGDRAHNEENKYRFEFTDMVMLCQAERTILEFKFPYPGMYMFHAHQAEFAELGWMAMFDVT